jgi:hypothetical protein
MRPDFASAMFVGYDGDLEIKDSGASHLECCGPPHQALCETGTWGPDVTVAFG